jgi:hypothetical protein
MLWSYPTAAVVFQIDAKFDRATSEFVLQVHGGRHHGRVERFKDAIAFHARLDALEQDLAAQRRENAAPSVKLKDS